MMIRNIYRDVTLQQIGESDVGREIRVAGWIENIRDHGGVSFVDLRDMYGVLQIVMRDTTLLDGLTREMSVSIAGLIEHRDEETYNPRIPTGTIEMEAHEVEVLGRVYQPLPFEIMTSKETREEVRLKYRYLDLRNQKVKDSIIFRSGVIAFLREKMVQMGFLEIQTPILCASSPEGARDYIVPSRKHKGKFYALPQAPQQYKQLLMVSGFDRYFQIAPCFRDEDARADRSPGEFYQLDFEMSFATQEDVFRVGEEVLSAVFEKFAPAGYAVTQAPYPVISYKQAMLEFGSDKPDLRNPLRIIDLTAFFQGVSSNPSMTGQFVPSGYMRRCPKASMRSCCGLPWIWAWAVWGIWKWRRIWATRGLSTSSFPGKRRRSRLRWQDSARGTRSFLSRTGKSGRPFMRDRSARSLGRSWD